MQKFKTGNLVTIKPDNKRTPKWIREGLNLKNPRKIQVAYFNKQIQHVLYYFGNNGIGQDISFVPFRASQLEKYNPSAVGRPRMRNIRIKK